MDKKEQEKILHIPNPDKTGEADRLEVQAEDRETVGQDQELPVDLGLTDPDEVLARLCEMHRSQGYLVIRDKLSPKMLRAIKGDKNNEKDVERYKLFQSVKQECKASWDYDHRTPMMYEVNRGLTNVYNMILNIFATYRNFDEAEFDAIHQAINRIEERLGMDKTDWIGGEDNAASDAGDVPPVPADSDGTE